MVCNLISISIVYARENEHVSKPTCRRSAGDSTESPAYIKYNAIVSTETHPSPHFTCVFSNVQLSCQFAIALLSCHRSTMVAAHSQGTGNNERSKKRTKSSLKPSLCAESVRVAFCHFSLARAHTRTRISQSIDCAM